MTKITTPLVAEVQDLWHTAEIELTGTIMVETTLTFAEPGSGITHTQVVPSYIAAGTILKGKIKLEIL